MAKATIGSIQLEFETFGDPENPALVLIMGLAMQMIAWPDEVCENWARLGFFVVRFDNRDSGLSTKFDSSGAPNIFAGLMGDASTAAYSLADMGNDVVGLMDHLNIQRAHVVGVSMGGMIAQQAVIDHPERFLSMCCMMSSTGAKDVGQPSMEVVTALLEPAGTDREAAIAQALETSRVISSSKYFDRDKELELIKRSYDRNFCPDGVMRQLMAVVVSPDRTEALTNVSIPTLVIHGLADKLVDPSGGFATASAIPDSKILTFEGMAHEVPEALWGEISDAVLANIKRSTHPHQG